MSAPSAPKPRKSPPSTRGPLPSPAPADGPLTTAELLAGTPPREFLVLDVLSSGTPFVLGAPAGSLKTAVAVDLAVSLGTGQPFLGRFVVPQPVDVLYFSGEDDRRTLTDLVEASLQAKHIDEARVHWRLDVPDFTDDADVAETVRDIAACRAEVVVFDPLYLAIAPGKPPEVTLNLCAVGPILRRVCRACLAAGATPVLVQHAVRSTRNSQSLFLDRLDVGIPGVAEYARQWVLLKPGSASMDGAKSSYRKRRSVAEPPVPAGASAYAVVGGSDGRHAKFRITCPGPSQGLVTDPLN